MKFAAINRFLVLSVSLALLGAGPAWSATPKKKAKASRAKIHAVSKVKPVANPTVPAVVAPVAAAVVTVPMVAVVETVAPTGYVPSKPWPAVNPYLAYQAPVVPVNPADNLRQVTSGVRNLLPSLPEGQSFLPTIKTVYPTGEKPLVVVTFKCPTELVGITPIPTKLLHDGVNGVFDLINATDLLSFNLQQVCQ